MQGFAIIGTICLVVELVNYSFEFCSATCYPVEKWKQFNKIFDPAILCVSLFVLEEFPLAVLRWVTRDFTEKPVGFLGYATGIVGMISPLARVVRVIICCCCACCGDDEDGSEECCEECGEEECCDEVCCDKRKPWLEWPGGICKGLAIIMTGIAVFIINLLNWVNVPPPGIQSCN